MFILFISSFPYTLYSCRSGQNQNAFKINDYAIDPLWSLDQYGHDSMDMTRKWQIMINVYIMEMWSYIYTVLCII